MENDLKCDNSVSHGTYIINKAQSVNLDPKILYESDTSVPLFELSKTTSEYIYSLQAVFMAFYKFGLHWDKFIKELDKDL